MQNKFKNPAPGKIVNIDGHNMHIFSAGQGDRTLVFMSGHATACPTLDFKPLWSLLTDEYKIAVVEKFGYGWSDITKAPRDLDTMLAHTREALKLAGFAPPYVLVPHSLSGLEAVYWAQKYPQEITAIIGLDPSVPDAAEALKLTFLTKIAVNITSFISRLGMSESTAQKALNENYPSFQSASLTDSDREALIEIFQRRTYTADMLREMSNNQEYVKMIRSLSLPSNVPVYFFSSDFKDAAKLGLKPEEFLQFHKNFLSNFKNAKHTILDCGHYIHSYEPEKIASEIKLFFENFER